MKLKITFLSLLASAAALAQNGSPAAYYNGFNFNQNGSALRTALATKITSTHTKTLSYAQAEEALIIVDRDPADATNTNLLMLYGYSDNLCPASTTDDKDHRRRNKAFEDDGTNANCMWNREHTYPKALGNPNLGETGPGADAHHLRAADKKRNADRNNDLFMDGSGNSFETGSQWYPGDEWKGDVARMMMYMYLRYGSQCLPKNVGVGTINTSDSNMIDLFLEWNAEDPVSQYEDNRNTYLGNASNSYGQGNRNPFIDNPYLATKIWGGPAAQDRWGLAGVNDMQLMSITVYPNPAVNNEVNIQSEVELESIQLININGQIVQRISKPMASDNTYTLRNLPQGFYFLRLEGNGGSVTRKVMVD